MYKSEIEEGLSHETKSTLYVVSHCGGKKDVAISGRKTAYKFNKVNKHKIRKSRKNV